MFETGSKLAAAEKINIHTMFQGDVPGASWGLAAQAAATETFISFPGQTLLIGSGILQNSRIILSIGNRLQEPAGCCSGNANLIRSATRSREARSLIFLQLKIPGLILPENRLQGSWILTFLVTFKCLKTGVSDTT